MNIISVSGATIPQGTFIGVVTVIGATREECIEALLGVAPFADDIGASVREDGLPIYTMIGGAISQAPVAAQPPAVVPAIASLTRRQLFLVMAQFGLITLTEAEAAALGVIPATLLATFEAILTPAELSAAKITFATMTVISRDAPLVAVAQAAFGKTSEEIDQMFFAGALI